MNGGPAVSKICRGVISIDKRVLSSLIKLASLVIKRRKIPVGYKTSDFPRLDAQLPRYRGSNPLTDSDIPHVPGS